MTVAHIRVLPTGVVNKIAAGEMIERPASVVKELVENALDAGATQITLKIDGSLDRSLSVVDDGHGMSADQARLALERHATSKISDVDDLSRLTTLGFRGEALPSIASVSAMTITTCPVGGGHASELEIVGGELLSVRETTRTKGTTVLVQNLYFNVPVRRKFMKTERGELRTASRVILHLALAYPEVRFTLERTGAEPIRYERATSLEERAAQVFGRRIVEGMLVISADVEGIEVRGLIGRPEASRGTRDGQILILNGRPVSSPLLNHAVKRGFGDLIPGNRHPFSLLHLTVDPASVDVNVHPTKREVKFSREGFIFEVVRDAVAVALGALSPVGELDHPDLLRESPPDRGTPPSQARRPPLDLWSEPSLVTDAPSGEEPPAEPIAERKFWQLHRRYVFAQTHSGVLVIDQHAAHERILYEKAIERLAGAPATSQRLLFPETIELRQSEFELFSEIRSELERIGFEVESFGGRSIIIHAIPDGYQGADVARLLLDVLDEYVDSGRSVRETRERLARAFACRAAVKSGTPLSAEEMSALIDSLFATGTPHGDPHGRPTLIRFSLKELDRRFGRE